MQLQKQRNLPVLTNGPVALVYGDETVVDAVKESENNTETADDFDVL